MLIWLDLYQENLKGQLNNSIQQKISLEVNYNHLIGQ
jgi:hypothetical protein